MAPPPKPHNPVVEASARFQKKRAERLAAEAEVRPDGAGARVVFAEPQVAAPGQAAVFYEGPAVVGGGWIES